MTNENDREERVQSLCDDILTDLSYYAPDVWGDALGAVVASVLTSKSDAAQIAEEEAAKRRIQE